MLNENIKIMKNEELNEMIREYYNVKGESKVEELKLGLVFFTYEITFPNSISTGGKVGDIFSITNFKDRVLVSVALTKDEIESIKSAQ
jgi:hypothetical protein